MNKKIILFWLLLSTLSVSARTLYLMPNTNWLKDGAKFAAYYFNGSDNGWSGLMNSVGNNTYSASVPDNYQNVIFVRLSSSTTTPSWDVKWNQTADLTVPTDGKNLYTIAEGAWDKGDGSWSTYGNGGGDNGDNDNPGDYSSAVPSECSDIMLQAFYWDSFKGGQSGDNYGKTTWPTLQSQAAEINQYFDLVWLAPSASSSDNNGYLPRDYSSQTSYHGTVGNLKQLINTFHGGNTKVLADVVINHCSNKSSWCDFQKFNFSDYGMFTPQSSWITKDDEGASKCSVGNNNDDGQESNRNYGAARDWDHKNSEVQAMCKAYLKWLMSNTKYDGFRYDYCVGFHVSHVNDYNQAAKPYFSVMEYWNGDVNTLKSRIDQAGKNSLVFDFANKYTALRDGIYQKNYSKLRNAGLRGVGYSKYAVTFVDNHDTFHRSGAQDVANKSDGSSINDASLMLQCNAYILSLPGVPCIFYPHWIKYKEQIKKMIDARRVAGIHSESSMSEEAGSGYYRATVYGKTGSVKLFLGSAANDAAPAGYTLALKADKVAMYYQGTGHAAAVEEVSGQKPATSTKKIVRNGQVLIEHNGKTYNLLGIEVGDN